MTTKNLVPDDTIYLFDNRELRTVKYVLTVKNKDNIFKVTVFTHNLEHAQSMCKNALPSCVFKGWTIE